MSSNLASTLAQVIPVLALTLVIEIRVLVAEFVKLINGTDRDDSAANGGKNRRRPGRGNRSEMRDRNRYSAITLRLIVLMQVWMLAFLGMLELYCLHVIAKPISADMTGPFIVIAIGIAFVTFAPLGSIFLLGPSQKILAPRPIVLLAYAFPYLTYGLYGLIMMPSWQ